jgi:hypothetical protein
MADEHRRSGDSDTTLSAKDLWRQMKEEFHAGNEEMRELRSEVHQLSGKVEQMQQSFAPIMKVISGNGAPGIVAIIMQTQERLGQLQADMTEIKAKGTHPSQLEIRSLRESFTQQGARIDNIDKRDREAVEERHRLRNELGTRITHMETDHIEADRRQEKRRWQWLVLILGTGVNLLVAVGSMIAALVALAELAKK